MLTRKCDICGAEMRMTTPRYKVTFDGWLYTEEVDICMDCFKRIAKEIKQADTPQTDCDKCIWNVCNYNEVDWDADTPQTEQMKTADYCDICKQDMCEFCIADASNPYCVPSHYEIKQTETSTNSEKLQSRVELKQTDCGWK